MRWPSTLRAQFVAVVTAAVILSNLALVAILEIGREGELRGARLAGVIDRVAERFDFFSRIPGDQRDDAVHALSGNVIRYAMTEEPPFEAGTMTDEERRIAASFHASENENKTSEIRVRLTPPPRIPTGASDTPAVEISQAMSFGGWLTARFTLPTAPSPAPDILIAAALGSILTGAAAAWLAGRVSRPLSALAFAAHEVARGRTVPQLQSKGPEDIRVATDAFNQMSDRVTRTLETQRQLLSAVGHDLRTPIAAMRITAEFVDDEETRDRLTRNLDELQSLTESVLSAARAGPGEARRRVDLAALLESVCDDLVDLGMPVELDVSGTSPCPCRSNEIRRAVRNLIENAVRYGGGARVALRTEGDFFVTMVEDDGPGIPDDRLQDVFEPFVRLEASRNTATGGAGLGLTLARSIAREHGGDVVLENRKNRDGRILGLRAILRLPREKARVTQDVATPHEVAVAEGAMAK
jgi:signal transduction histidine kinase